MKDKGLLSIEQVEVNEMQIENLRLVDIIVRLHVRNKARKLRVEFTQSKLESLCLNNDGAWLKQRLIRKLFLKLISTGIRQHLKYVRNVCIATSLPLLPT